MKKFMLVIIAAAFVLPFMSGCKKGPNDPGISLSSRDGRLIAEWKLTKISGTRQGFYLGDATTYSYAYDGTTFTETYAGNSESGTGAFEMTIEKDGVITSKESFTPNGGTANVISGTNQWYWWDNDDNKTGVYLMVYGEYLFDSGLYLVDRLSSKELILHYVYSYNDNGDIYSADIFYTFEAQ